MKKERICQTNPYLHDRVQQQTALVASVSSSSAIEGIKIARGIINHYLEKTGKKITRHKISTTD